MLEADRAVAADHEGLGHAIDAPVDRRRAALVRADMDIRISERGEEGQRLRRAELRALEGQGVRRRSDRQDGP